MFRKHPWTSLAVSSPPSGVRWRCFSVTSLVPRIVRRFFGPNCEVYSPHFTAQGRAAIRLFTRVVPRFLPVLFWYLGFHGRRSISLVPPSFSLLEILPDKGGIRYKLLGDSVSFCVSAVVKIPSRRFDDPPSMSVFLDEVSF